MHLQKGKKSIIYFFLLIIVGSINNLSFNNIKFDNIKNIKVTGLNNIDNTILTEQIKRLNLKNIFFISKDNIKKVIDSNSLVEKYYVFKIYPSTLNIKILKTDFLARINLKNQIFLVGSNGKLTDSDYYDKQLPFIFGKPEVNEFLLLKKIIDNSQFKYDQILNLYYFPSKRWDLELKGNILLKLPKNNVAEKLDYIFNLQKDLNFKSIKIIDARIQNQIILND